MNNRHELKSSALEMNLEIPRQGLAIFTFGNASVYSPELGLVAIKPSGVPYEELSSEKMVVLNLQGDLIEGDLRPSSDTPTHLQLYREFPGIRGVVHTHSIHATAWAQALRGIPVYGTTHADHSPQEIPCVPPMTEERISGDYELETGLQISEYFAEQNINPEYCPMVLVGGHGAFTWGESPEKSLYNARVLEELAQMAYMTEVIAGGKNPPLPSHLIDKHFSRKHGPNAYYGQN